MEYDMLYGPNFHRPRQTMTKIPDGYFDAIKDRPSDVMKDVVNRTIIGTYFSKEFREKLDFYHDIEEAKVVITQKGHMTEKMKEKLDAKLWHPL